MLIPLGILAQGIAGNYWIVITGGAASEQRVSVAVTPAGNATTFFEDNAASPNTAITNVRYDTAGTLSWQKRLTHSLPILRAEDISLDGSENNYSIGWTFNSSSQTNYFLVARNSTGGLIWQRQIGGNSDRGFGITTSGSDFYAVGQSFTAGASNGFAALIIKSSTAPTLAWQRALDTTVSANQRFNDVTVDAAGDILAVGVFNPTSTSTNENRGLIAKYDSAGTLVWQRQLNGGNDDEFFAVATDSSNNVYAVGRTRSVSPNTRFMTVLAKYNSSGTLQWQQVLDNGTNAAELCGVKVDSAGGVYCSGNSGAQTIIAKYDSTGALVWQRRIAASTGGLTSLVRNIDIDSAGDLYVPANVAFLGYGGTDSLVLKLPNNGSLVGTYAIGLGDITYSASTLTAITPSFTSSASTLTGYTPSFSFSTPTLPESAASLSSQTVPIP